MKREKGPDGRGQRGKNDILLLTGKFRGPFVVGASAFNPKQVPAGPLSHQRAPANAPARYITGLVPASRNVSFFERCWS